MRWFHLHHRFVSPHCPWFTAITTPSLLIAHAWSSRSSLACFISIITPSLLIAHAWSLMSLLSCFIAIVTPAFPSLIASMALPLALKFDRLPLPLSLSLEFNSPDLSLSSLITWLSLSQVWSPRSPSILSLIAWLSPSLHETNSFV